MKPALTADQWEDVIAAGPHYVEECVGPDPEACHWLAALNLYGQPFGFTRENVHLLRGMADAPRAYEKDTDWMRSLADRIEALLPPEGK